MRISAATAGAVAAKSVGIFESAYQLSDIIIIIIPTDFMKFYELSSSLNDHG